jgi:hypothetical protein
MYFNREWQLKPHGFPGRILRRPKAGVVQTKIKQLLSNGFDAALAGETIVLDRSDRECLYGQTAQTLLDEIVADLDPGV